MSVLYSMIKKEALHLVRDYRTMLVAVVIPVILLLLFGFAISTEVNDVKVAAVVERYDDASRGVIDRMQASGYFTLCAIVGESEGESMLRRGDADALIVLRDGGNASTQCQIIVDASNTSVAQTVVGYLQGIAGNSVPATVNIRSLYNPQLKSAYNFVPGILGMIFILICAMMTSVSIVSEKESGSMDMLLVSPARPSMIIIGKLVPYFVISCVILALMLIISYGVLDLPFSASAVNVVWVTLLYIILALSVGLLVSTLVDSQVSALIVSAVLFMLPVLMLSGMIFPIGNMPQVLQWVSCMVPARWYISAMRTLMIQQLPADSAGTEVTVLAVMTVVILTVAIKKFKSRI